MRKVDMHLHSYASDGEWSPEQLLEQVDKHDIKIFSVCDHDVTNCVPYMMDLVKDRRDLTYIPGVEASVLYKGIEHHILTYKIDPSDDRLLDLLKINTDYREDSNARLMDYLHESYPQVTRSGYEAYEYNPYQGGWRAYGYLESLGVIKDIRDYFKVTKGFKFEKAFVKAEEYLPKVVAMGYIPILAHPPAYQDGDFYDENDLDYLRNLGLAGIECHTKYLNDQENSQYYVNYCDKHGLWITGGSDCHGGFVGRNIGVPPVDESMIRIS